MQPSTEISSRPSTGFIIPAFQLIKNPLNQVKELINEQLTSYTESSGGCNNENTDINKLFEYMRARSGKMLRPALVLLAGASCGRITDQHISVAAMVEMIHTATLLHDDVIDKGQKRRGAPTVNNLWGNQSAVLMGDFLLSRVFKMCAALESGHIKVIAAAAVRLCEGELKQISQRQNWQLTEEQYIEAITEKSAVLFSSCCSLGASLSQADEATVKSLSDFGLNAGIAFQIADDLLDIIGDENKTGKTKGCDIEGCKPTLALIYLLKNADPITREKIIQSYLENNNNQSDKTEFAELLGRNGALEYVRGRSQQFVNKAIESLSNIENTQAREALIATARFMADRTT